MFAKSQPNLIKITNDDDSEINESVGSLRSGTSTNNLNEDEPKKENKGKHKVIINTAFVTYYKY
jgi:hypothetical protein